jgi:GNAT superfamily N-acetyltransferase
MTALRFDNLEQYSDVLRSRRGDAIGVRFVEPRDAEELQNYFRSLSSRSRYSRFLGAFHADSERFEFGLSIGDRWQGHGIGAALLSNLECRAAAFGAGSLFGDTLRSNAAMISLARKSGFAFGNNGQDWKLVHFEKQISLAPKDIPCASWRIAAAKRLERRGHLAQ